MKGKLLQIAIVFLLFVALSQANKIYTGSQTGPGYGPAIDDSGIDIGGGGGGLSINFTY